MAGHIDNLKVSDNDYDYSGPVVSGYLSYASDIVQKWSDYINILQAILDEDIILGKQRDKIDSMIRRAKGLRFGVVGLIDMRYGAAALCVSQSMNAYIGEIEEADDILY